MNKIVIWVAYHETWIVGNKIIVFVKMNMRKTPARTLNESYATSSCQNEG